MRLDKVLDQRIQIDNLNAQVESLTEALLAEESEEAVTAVGSAEGKGADRASAFLPRLPHLPAFPIPPSQINCDTLFYYAHVFNPVPEFDICTFDLEGNSIGRINVTQPNPSSNYRQIIQRILRQALIVNRFHSVNGMRIVLKLA
jgi:hypothetical protein